MRPEWCSMLCRRMPIRPDTTMRPANLKFRATTIVAIGAVLAGGLFILACMAGDANAKRLDSELRQRLREQAKEIANLINPETVQKLSFDASDEGTPAFEQIREQMSIAAKRMGVVGIRSTKQRSGKLVFGPQSYHEQNSFASALGSHDLQMHKEFLASISNLRPVVVGPYTTGEKTLISAQAPVLDRQNGGVLCAVVVDADGESWQRSLNAAHRRPLLVTAGYTLLMLAGTGIVCWQVRLRRADSLRLKGWIIVPVALDRKSTRLNSSHRT